MKAETKTGKPIEKQKKIREGKAKILYETNHPQGFIIQSFKDDATAFNGIKKDTIPNKGRINNAVSSWVFAYLEKMGVPNHFVEKLSETDMLIQSLKMIPVELVIRNKATGSLCKRLGIKKGEVLNPPLVEYFYKSDELNDPLISESHIFHFKWASQSELSQMVEAGLKVNQLLSDVFMEVGLELIDFKLEFGKTSGGALLLADEFTPDGCRLWDKQTGESVDKDRFRQDLGGVKEAYEDVCRRLKSYFEGHA